MIDYRVIFKQGTAFLKFNQCKSCSYWMLSDEFSALCLSQIRFLVLTPLESIRKKIFHSEKQEMMQE